MNIELKIKVPNDSKARAYVEFYYEGKRVREYTGNNILMDLEPNKEKDPQRRLELLYELKHALTHHIKTGNYPAKETAPPNEKISTTTYQALSNALTSKLKMKLSQQYKDNLSLVYKQFTDFLTSYELESPFESIKVARLESFLEQFNSSGTYYMKKRSDLGILFSLAAKLADVRSIARDTHTERSKAKLHNGYFGESCRAFRV